MTLHSIWGESAPPGTWSLFSDGDPSIAVFNRFYVFGAGVPGGSIYGGKFWIPATATDIPPQARLQLYTSAGASGTPLAEKVVPITVGAGQWQHFDWDVTLAIPANGVLMSLGVTFEPTTYRDRYVIATNARPNAQLVTSATLATFGFSDYDGSSGSYRGTGYKMPWDSATLSNSQIQTTSYGIDLILSDSIPAGTVLHGEEEPPPVFGTDVVSENELVGTIVNNWLTGVTSEEMPAFGRSTYVEPGATINFSVNYNAAFTFDVFRLGHYQDNGARLVEAGIAGAPTAQPTPVAIPGGNGAVTCSAWSVNASWEVPDNALPGWYQILLRGANGTDHGYVLFMVSDSQAKRDVLIVTGDATWHAAYNGFGGNNVYGATKDVGNANNRAFCSTYDKPVITRDYVPQTHFFNNTYPYLKWSERMGYEAGVSTIEQIKNDPTILDGRDLIVFTGHNEYVPDVVYDKVIQLMGAGQRFVNAAGNDFFWRIRFTNGAFDSGVDGRVMWCKKDTMSGPTTGPNAVPGHVGGQPFTTQADWTGTWQDTRYSNRKPSADHWGDRFIANGIRSDKVKVPYGITTSPAWRDCPGISALTDGQTYEFAAGTLGMEWDMPVDGGSLIENVRLSSSIVTLTGVASDINGESYTGSTTAEHGITLTKVDSGYALNLNSDQWSWALDSIHLRGSAPEDLNAMQMMLNVIRDLGVAGDTTSIQAAGLVAPTQRSLSEYGFADIPIEVPPGMYFNFNGGPWINLKNNTPVGELPPG